MNAIYSSFLIELKSIIWVILINNFLNFSKNIYENNVIKASKVMISKAGTSSK